MLRRLAGVAGLIAVILAGVVTGQEAEESRLEPTVQALQTQVTGLNRRVNRLEAGGDADSIGAGASSVPAPTPSSGLSGSTTSVWGRIEFPTTQALGQPCADGGLSPDNRVMLADPTGTELDRGLLDSGMVMDRAYASYVGEVVCVYTFHFDEVPTFASYQLHTSQFWTVAVMPPIPPYGIVLYFDPTSW